MNDIKTKLGVGKTGVSNQFSVTRDQSAVALGEDPPSRGAMEDKGAGSDGLAGKRGVLTLDLDLNLAFDPFEQLETGTECYPVVRRKPAVKAPEDRRSPRSGGARERLGKNEKPWGRLRGLSDADGGRMGMYATPESPCDFVSQDAGGELITPRKCPEFRNWGFATSGIPSCSPREKAQLDTPTDNRALQRGPTGAGAPLGLEDVRLGWVSIEMPALRAFGVWQKSALRDSYLRHVRAVPGPEGRNIYSQRAEPRSAPFRGGITRESRTGCSYPEWGNDTPIEMPESRSDFILHNVDGEWLIRLKCSEFRYQSDVEEKRNGKETEDECGEVGGIAVEKTEGRKMESSLSFCPLFFRQQIGFDPRLETPKTPESGSDFIPQDTGGELVVRQECPVFSRAKVGFASGNCRRRRSPVAALGVSRKSTRFCRPFLVEDSLPAATLDIDGASPALAPEPAWSTMDQCVGRNSRPSPDGS